MRFSRIFRSKEHWLSLSRRRKRTRTDNSSSRLSQTLLRPLYICCDFGVPFVLLIMILPLNLHGNYDELLSSCSANPLSSKKQGMAVSAIELMLPVTSAI
ncbi:hypothetical protein VNO80_10112 [Phaseolus coccineus]|uniref:Uncharacterized protein n=1 Tax=Phaseolus coccineus TaxID=3886 RepID=A0AAN9RA65_PHACN